MGRKADSSYYAVAVVVPASGGDVGEVSDGAVEAVGADKEASCDGRAARGKGDVWVS